MVVVPALTGGEVVVVEGVDVVGAVVEIGGVEGSHSERAAEDLVGEVEEGVDVLASEEGGGDGEGYGEVGAGFGQ